MIKKTVILLCLLALAIPGCSAIRVSETVITPTIAYQPSTTPAPTTSTPSRVNVVTDTYLYDGPGNAAFDPITSITRGNSVQVRGSYGDFVEVIYQDVRGYIWKNALEATHIAIPALDIADVPWEPLYKPDCSAGVFNSNDSTADYSNTSDGYIDTESSAIPLKAPLHLAMRAARVEGQPSAAIKLLGIPEPQTDEWWKGITRLDFGYADGSYYVGVRDGSSPDYNYYSILPIAADKPVKLIFHEQEGKSFSVLNDENEQVLLVDLTKTKNLDLPGGLFPNGQVYIGTTVPPHSTFIVTGLHVGIDASGKWSLEQNGYYTEPGLAALAAAHHLTIGTELSLDGTADPRYCNIIRRDFNLVALSEFSDPAVWIGPGQYDFSRIDRAVDYAVHHGWKIRASHLVWGAPETLPDWLKKGTYSKDETIQILQQYITDVVTRYRGRVQEWSIANEATNRSFSTGADFWNDRIGPEYIGLAFRTARAADPEGILIFNEDNNQAPQDAGTKKVIDKMYATVERLKSEGVPIDAVGMQMHIFLPWNSSIRPTKADAAATMQKFASLGVRILITEFDVDMARQDGSRSDKWSTEAGIYRDMMDACLESGVCDSFTTWQFADGNSWITCSESWCVKDAGADPLPFDDNYEPKPAYFALREALTVTPIPLPTPTK
jgi:endo-1,4-beta-xylanase